MRLPLAAEEGLQVVITERRDRPISSNPGEAMQSIQTMPENVEQIRERLRKMSDLELHQYGRSARNMADPRKNHGNPSPAFRIQLNEARAEWRRRHPANPDGTARPPRLPDLSANDEA
jgi:hypothetical protein